MTECKPLMAGSSAEINFSMAAFLLAMTSNVACALRGVTSKEMETKVGLKAGAYYTRPLLSST